MRSENEKSRLSASVAVVKMRTEQRKLEVMQSRSGAVRRSDGKQQELSTEGQKIAGILDGMSMEQMQETFKRGIAALAGNPGLALKPAEGGESAAAPDGSAPKALDAAAGGSEGGVEGNGVRDEE
jgi:hypothetical protein